MAELLPDPDAPQCETCGNPKRRMHHRGHVCLVCRQARSKETREANRLIKAANRPAPTPLMIEPRQVQVARSQRGGISAKATRDALRDVNKAADDEDVPKPGSHERTGLALPASPDRIPGLPWATPKLCRIVLLAFASASVRHAERFYVAKNNGAFALFLPSAGRPYPEGGKEAVMLVGKLKGGKWHLRHRRQVSASSDTLASQDAPSSH